MPENGTEMLAQRSDASKENRDGFFGHVQLFHMGDETASLDGIDESGRGFFAPIAHRLFRGQAVKRIVNLHGAKLGAVKGELPGRWPTGRIKGFGPSFVNPPACAYKQSLHSK